MKKGSRERMNDLEQCLRAEQTRSERLSSDLIRSAKVRRGEFSPSV